MSLPDIRHRAGYLLLAVVLGHIILISAQVGSPSGVPVLETVVFGAFAEVQRGVSAVFAGVRRAWSGYVDLRGVRSQNDELKRGLAALQVELQRQRALADRSRGLQRLLELRDHSTLKTMAADVVAAGATPDFRTITIDRGERDGLRRDMAVIAPAGVVGRIVVPSARAAKVQLLVDRNAAAGALIQRSRAQGVVVGRGDDRLRLEYVAETADIVTGDLVMTSGIDGMFPKGFAIGVVEVVEKSGNAYKRILVRPAVDSRALEEVLVVLARGQHETTGESTE